ncbi:MAG: serine/threonine protein kinase, partial [Phycisphaerales bacterium]|nr:serine/threonine protein kinase [Phycisphaerales bacterium]
MAEPGARPSVKEIFADALEQEASVRRSYVEARCAGDVDRCRRVLDLLEAHEGAEAFMGAPTFGADHVDGPSHEDLVGTRLGRYDIESVLGQGGFGVVYLARQHEPVERTVAIKVIRPEAHSPSSEARLHAERQILARMEHANIARVHDAGRTSDGRSYVVMEYVEGLPITDFCDARGSSVRERLMLFERVCLAVQHAHLKGVIHRDLKPSNVLVTEIDGVAEPRVIDFGIAKEDADESGRTMLTVAGQIVGTPAFMSPEQIDGSGGVDTRSDVYALGAMLYEILARTTPYDRKRLSSVGLAGLARIICEEDPPRPSSRVMQAEDLDPRDARMLSGEIRGELDWI